MNDKNETIEMIKLFAAKELKLACEQLHCETETAAALYILLAKSVIQNDEQLKMMTQATMAMLLSESPDIDEKMKHECKKIALALSFLQEIKETETAEQKAKKVAEQNHSRAVGDHFERGGGLN